MAQVVAFTSQVRHAHGRAWVTGPSKTTAPIHGVPKRSFNGGEYPYLQVSHPRPCSRRHLAMATVQQVRTCCTVVTWYTYDRLWLVKGIAGMLKTFAAPVAQSSHRRSCAHRHLCTSAVTHLASRAQTKAPTAAYRHGTSTCKCPGTTCMLDYK